MTLTASLDIKIKKGLQSIYGVEAHKIEYQATNKDFEGDLTVVLFPLLRFIKDNPARIGAALGEYLKANSQEIKDYAVVKGFLNLIVADGYYLDYLKQLRSRPSGQLYQTPAPQKAIMVEYASPNTNKPLHLGHIRNILLGHSVSQILKACGHRVCKTQIINDRGIHICKSMLAWQKFGQGETPESSVLKGDKLVGKYYVLFDKHYRAEVAQLVADGKSEEAAKAQAPILIEAQNMLRAWESKDPEIMKLWQAMNGWVYDGFEVTYKSLGVDFDKVYYESETYLLGKDIIEKGLAKGIFYQKPDSSVWIDLSSEGLDEKLLLRADGTSVYMTQDIGTAVLRSEEFPGLEGMIYTVGNEQEYHFKVLFLILKKMGFPWAESLYHLSYGMVDLPEGKMKSREGTVIDADDLIAEMQNVAAAIADELGKLDDYSPEQKEALCKKIGMAALKYYILKVDAKKRILFDPKESIDFNGNTGPFIQYAYVRIQSLLKAADKADLEAEIDTALALHKQEKELIKQLEIFPQKLALAAETFNPGEIANYVYELVRSFNSFYQSVPVLRTDIASQRSFRVQLCESVGRTIAFSLDLLGIEAPERM